jgi:hypothetical protein
MGQSSAKSCRPYIQSVPQLRPCGSDPAVQKMAAQRWFDLADERNRWGRDVFDALVA